jgi:DNA-binding CsgD family transcriptional regulator
LLILRRGTGDAMNGRILESRRWNNEQSTELLDLLSQSDTPALATDIGGHVVFWNRAAERLLGRATNQVLGRRCYDVLGGKDIFGNRFCHENCSVVSMTRKGEVVQGFEIVLGSSPKLEQNINVTVLKIPGSRPELFTLVHILQPIDRSARLTRALERLGAQKAGTTTNTDGWEPVPSPGPISVPKAPPLTDREKEILRWVAAGLQNKEIAHKLGISLATVRNHIHNILEKLDVHSKLEAVSLAFRQGWVSGPNGELGISAEPLTRQ